MKKEFLAAALLLLLAVPEYTNAQNTALGFTRMDRNPRTSALAGAGAASTDNGWYGAFSHAAQLGYALDKADVGAGLQFWEPSNDADKTTNLHGGAAVRFGNLGVALGGAIQMGVEQGSYTPTDRLMSLGVAYNIQDVVSIGLNGRYAAQSLTQEAKLGAFSLDFSVMGCLTPNLSLAVGVGNIGPKVQGSLAEYEQPAHLFGGLAWVLAPAKDHRIETMLDAEYNFDGSYAAALGAEYAYNKMLFARAGYRLASTKAPIPSHLAMGAGFRFGGFRLEASYLAASEMLGGSFCVGAGFTF